MSWRLSLFRVPSPYLCIGMDVRFLRRRVVCYSCLETSIIFRFCRPQTKTGLIGFIAEQIMIVSSLLGHILLVFVFFIGTSLATGTSCIPFLRFSLCSTLFIKLPVSNSSTEVICKWFLADRGVNNVLECCC